jgi:hypothetical protein
LSGNTCDCSENGVVIVQNNSEKRLRSDDSLSAVFFDFFLQKTRIGVWQTKKPKKNKKNMEIYKKIML